MKVIQSLQFRIGFLALIICAGILFAMYRPTKKGDTPVPAKESKEEPVEKQAGFMDAVKNPEEWQQELDDSAHSRDKAIIAAKSWGDRKVDKEVRRFLFGDGRSGDAWQEGQVLRSLGSRVQPTLLACLSDASLHDQLVKPSGQGLWAKSPFDRLCDLLADSPTPACVPLLTPFLDDPSPQIRKEAALVIGCVGSKACIPALRKALADSDEYVRSYAIIGLDRAMTAMRLDDAARRELFADLKSLVFGGKNGDKASQLLLDLDAEKAKEFFLSDQILAPESNSLHEVLCALNDKRMLVPRDKLLGLIQGLKIKTEGYPGTYQMAETLRALGQHQVPEDRKIMEKYLTHNEKTVASGAASGLLASHGLDGYRDRVWATLKERGVGGLTEAQRYYYAVSIFDSEVNNGGLTQYFFNPSGDEWRAALAGLEAMGSKERLAILREAIARFGKSGPSSDRDKRMTQLSSLAKADEATFEKLDSRYYKSTEVIDVLAMRFVLKNPEAFR